MTPDRYEKFKKVAAVRQPSLTVILENVHDQHNIGAVLRSCDAVGLLEIFVLNTEEGLATDHITVGKRTSMGTRKWVKINYYTDAEACFRHVRSKYDRVLSTYLDESSKKLHDLDLCQSTALMFGNERDGLSKIALSYSDGNFIIPQVGMGESLNISVACAVSLYEAYRQRQVQGWYDENPPLNPQQQADLLADFCDRHESGYMQEKIRKINP